MNFKNNVFVMIIIIITISIAHAGQDFDFRKSVWGMTQGEVKKTEKAEIIDAEADTLCYQGEVAGLDCFVFYYFTDGKLSSSGYGVTEEHMNKNGYIDDYDKLKTLLSKKYGKPTDDDVIWKNDLYKDDYQDWGFAVSMGQLVYQSAWENEKTRILLYLRGDNFNVFLGIKYVSKDMTETIRENREKESLNDL